MDDFVTASVDRYRRELAGKRALCALSGGVDSSVAAVLLHRAIGDRLTCVFVDHGLLRKDEGDTVERVFREQFDMNLIRVDAKERFLHYDYKDMTHYIGKLNWYAGREVRDYFDYLEGRGQNDGLDAVNSAVRSRKFKVYYRLPMFLRCWLMFVYSYVFRGGFLDGREGFLYHYMYHRFYRTLVDAKIYEHLRTGKPFEAMGPLKE